MTEVTYSVERDLKEAKTLVEALVPYVYEDELYGKAGGFFGNVPSLTIGAVLLRLRRLRALHDHLTEAQRFTLGEIEALHADVYKEWRVHYDAKIEKEAISRLNTMRAFFDDCAQSPRQCAGSYMPEALRRTIVQEIVLLMASSGMDAKAVRVKIHETDSHLRGVASPSAFIWDVVLQPVYPQETFWWLYARPQEGSK